MFLKEIWCEGDPRNDWEACHLGYGKGSTLKEACLDLANHNAYFKEHANLNTMKYKNCKLFDNETEARVLNG